MLLVCGYDKTQIIAEMNTSQTESSQPNDVDKMLDYMKQTFLSDSRLVDICMINIIASFLDFVKMNGCVIDVALNVIL